MYRKETITLLKEALQQPLPGKEAQERMAGRVLPMPDEVPDHARLSAVLCLLFAKEEALNVLLIQRTHDGRQHSGQIGFPGGKMEPTDADLLATALREAEEEVGIHHGNIELIGNLTPLYIPVSNFKVYPYIAYAPQQPDYNINHREVAQILEVPLQELLHPERKRVIDVTSPATTRIIRDVHAYELPDGTIIWGATAMILSELEVIFEKMQ